MVLPMPQPYDSQRPRRLPALLQLRVSDVQHRFLALEAESRGMTVAAVVRDMIDKRLDGFTRESDGMPMRQALEEDPDLTGLPDAQDA